MQSELFELTSSKSREESSPSKPTFIERTVFALRLDQAIGLVLVLLVFYVLTFSWGVERGKRLAFEARPAKPAVAETVTVPEVPVVPVAKVAETADPVQTAAVQKEPPQTSVLEKKPAGKYTIQYVTYVTQSAADREVRRISKMGHSAFVIPSGKHFQVCIEAFQTRQEASQSLKQLRAQRTVSVDAYVRAIPV